MKMPIFLPFLLISTLREEIIVEEFPAEEKFAELKIANLVEIRNLLFRNLWKMFAIRNLLFRNSWKMFVPQFLHKKDTNS